MAIAGKNSLVKWSSAAVAFSSESMVSNSSAVFRVASTSIRDFPWAPGATITVRSTSGVVSSTRYVTNRLNGSVQFTSTGQIPSTSLTISGSYLPLRAVANAREYSYTLTATNEPDTVFGSSWMTRKRTLLDGVATLSQFWTSSGSIFANALDSSSEQPVVLEFYSESTASFDLRMWSLINSDAINSAVNALVDDSVSFDLAVDADGRGFTFSTQGA